MAKAEQVFHWRADGEKAFGYAQAVKSGSTLYISGTMSVDEQFAVVAPNDMAAQIKNVYEGLKATLTHFELTFEHVVEEVMYTTDMAALLANNEIRKSYYQGAAPPAATALEVKGLAFDGQVVEIKAIATFE